MILKKGNIIPLSRVPKFSFQVNTNVKELEQVLDKFAQMRQPHIPEKDWLQCKLALAEGFTNAVRHAHRGLPEETPIKINILTNQDFIEICIWDSGPPFDLERFLRTHDHEQPTLSDSGQGLWIISSVSSELSYTRHNNLNCLRIVKRFSKIAKSKKFLKISRLNVRRLWQKIRKFLRRSIFLPKTSEVSDFCDLGPIVSSDWLEKHLHHPNIVIIDCRFRLTDAAWGGTQYKLNHIPGAFYLDLEHDLSSPIQSHGGRHPLPNPGILAQKFASIGITSGKTMVIAYDDSGSAFAARLWWLMRYLGHKKVAVLDGGLKEWKRKKYRLTNGVSSSKPGSFCPQIQSEKVANIDQIRNYQNIANFIIIDSRESDRYEGKREPIDPIAGHIPSAVNFPWVNVINSEGKFHSIEKQGEIWSTLPDGDELIFYCGSGVTACVNLLSLELVRTGKNKRLYPGGWSDWCSYLP